MLVVQYDPAWPLRFSEIRAVIQRTIAGTYYAVEHVGSTSVPGMAAKPIIDIDIVAREGRFADVRRKLEALGYVYEGDKGIPGRDAFDLQDAGLRSVLMQHHLYVCEAESAELRRHRAFRDFLLAHPDWVERLSRHKLELTSRLSDDRVAYQEEKSAMVEEILALALEESKEQ